MDEATQMFHVLHDTCSADFWENDRCRGWSMDIKGGMSVGIDPQGSNWTWRIARPDGSQRGSSQAFPSVEEAKNHLRAELNRRREDLLGQSVGPARLS